MNADIIEKMFIDSMREPGMNDKFVEALRAKARLNGRKKQKLIVMDKSEVTWKGEI